MKKLLAVIAVLTACVAGATASTINVTDTATKKVKTDALPTGCNTSSSCITYADTTYDFACNTSISATSATSNPANCSAGQAAGGVSSGFAAESCVNVYSTVRDSSGAMTARQDLTFSGSGVSVADQALLVPPQTVVTINRGPQGASYTSGNLAGNTITTTTFVTLLSTTFTQTVANQTIHVEGCSSFFVSAVSIAGSYRVTYNGVAQTAFQAFMNISNQHIMWCYHWRFTGAATAGSYTVALQLNKPTNYTSGAANPAGNVSTNSDDNGTLYVE